MLSDAEELMGEHATETKVGTLQIRFSSEDETKFTMVLPEIHPGTISPSRR